MFKEVLPINTVLKNGLQVYQIELSNWGNTGPSGDRNSLVSPIFRFPCAGIAIDPDSTADKCFLRPTTLDVNGNEVLNPSPFDLDEDVPLSKDQPLGGRFGFPRFKNFAGGWGIVCPGSERFGDDANSVSNGTVGFGGAVAAGAEFLFPSLRLLIFTDAGLPFPGVPPRAPLRVTRTYLNPNGEILYVPIFGRRRVRIIALPSSAFGAGVLKIRGFMLEANFAALPLPHRRPQEFPLTADLSLTAGAVATTVVEPLVAQYLELVSANGNVGAPIDIAVEVQD